eukprot:CAMPEP_0175163176 /NCGR_PEP_ID=MMETSP0087-20121206/25591_1 /TAXON_ID=136419 /ORGANISM="Unknown Unknown, Strain D1" /LENGTH=240 /DNA_ID=CAMNT_0016451825 /DNA_START=64 /DNA_END=786 /DNA_ORIENTATION=-
MALMHHFQETATPRQRRDRENYIHHQMDPHQLYSLQELLPLFFPDATPHELKVLAEWSKVKPIPQILVEKIKHLFEELDSGCKGVVKLGAIVSILAGSRKLARYVTVKSLGSDESDLYNVYVSLPQLLEYLFRKSHTGQMKQILKWGTGLRPLTNSQLRDLRRLFDHHDHDRDGQLDFNELKASTMETIGEEDISNFFNQIDWNRDQRISFDEFVKFYREVWEGSVIGAQQLVKPVKIGT